MVCSLQTEANRLNQKSRHTSPVTGHPGVLNKPADNSSTDRVAMGTNHKAKPETSALSQGEDVLRQSPALQRWGADV